MRRIDGLATGDHPHPRELRINRPAAGTLLVELAGAWSLQGGVPSIAAVLAQVDAGPRPQRLAFDVRGLTSWDSGLLMVVRDLAWLLQDCGAQALPPRTFPNYAAGTRGPKEADELIGRDG